MHTAKIIAVTLSLSLLTVGPALGQAESLSLPQKDSSDSLGEGGRIRIGDIPLAEPHEGVTVGIGGTGDTGISSYSSTFLTTDPLIPAPQERTLVGPSPFTTKDFTQTEDTPVLPAIPQDMPAAYVISPDGTMAPLTYAPAPPAKPPGFLEGKVTWKAVKTEAARKVRRGARRLQLHKAQTWTDNYVDTVAWLERHDAHLSAAGSVVSITWFLVNFYLKSRGL